MNKPYCCPVCFGHGIVAGGFYQTTEETLVSYKTTEQCRSCNGTGIVWGKDDENE